MSQQETDRDSLVTKIKSLPPKQKEVFESLCAGWAADGTRQDWDRLVKKGLLVKRQRTSSVVTYSVPNSVHDIWLDMKNT